MLSHVHAYFWSKSTNEDRFVFNYVSWFYFSQTFAASTFDLHTSHFLLAMVLRLFAILSVLSWLIFTIFAIFKKPKLLKRVFCLFRVLFIRREFFFEGGGIFLKCWKIWMYGSTVCRVEFEFKNIPPPSKKILVLCKALETDKKPTIQWYSWENSLSLH